MSVMKIGEVKEVEGLVVEIECKLDGSGREGGK
jgi:hypothetical protein